MIITVTLNAALDLTYHVDALVPHRTHRVRTVTERPGGKGLNVASLLHCLGEPVLATGFLGGTTGKQVLARLDASGLPARFAPIAAETRRTVTVADGADATGLWEPGPIVTHAEWSAFIRIFQDLLPKTEHVAHGPRAVVVLAGSLPRGLPPDAYATLIRIAHEHGARTVLDTSGEPLTLGLAAAPDVIKPNADEFAALGTSIETLARGGGNGTGSTAVVASDGPRGLLAVTAAGTWRAEPPEILTGNPTGAGDACVAALARGLRDDTPWPERLADAVALSAAAVAAPVAGTADLTLYRTLRPRVVVTPGDPRC